MKGWQRKRPAFYITAMRSVGKPKCVVVADVVLVYEERTTDR